MQKTKRSNIQGLTLLETLLVLAIMAAIVIFSMNQYSSFRRDADINTVQSNVDLLFDAMAQYFRANCKNQASPLYSAYNKQYVTISVSDLLTAKYLVVPNNLLPVTGIVDNSGTDQGYILQFNQVQNSNGTLPQRTVQLSSDNSYVSVGSIVLWQIQVGVKLKNTANAQQYRYLLGADCLVNLKNGFLETCANASSTSTTYAAWMRLPSYGSISQQPSPFWVSTPLVRQFSQMYDTYPILDLTDGTQTATQYYHCGG